MTTTPESWDDIGCLRLQVNCISTAQGLNVSELQKLKDDIALMHAREQEHKKERCQMKVCIVITAVLLVCVLALLMFMIYIGLPIRITHRLSDESWRAHAHDFKLQEATNLVPVTQADKDNHRNDRHGQQLNLKQMNDAVTKQSLEKELLDSTSWKVVEEKEPDQNQIPEFEVHTVQHPQSSIDAQGRAQSVAKSTEEDPTDARKDDEKAKDKEYDDDERPREEPRNKKSMSPPIDLGASLPEEPPEGERPETIKVIQDEPSESSLPKLADHTVYCMRALPPSPFKMMKHEVLRQSSQGVVWVCFPTRTFAHNVKKYDPVFNEVARRQTGTMYQYPFCYLDTRRLEKYHEHFCDDVEKITFVLEKRSDASRPVPLHFGRDPVESLVFRRLYRPDQDIQVSLVEDFLHDVHAGKLPEIVRPKGDL